MSKRGKILKKYKEAMIIMKEVFKEASILNSEDSLWLQKKVEKFDKENPLNDNQPVILPDVDDLPF